MTIRRNTPVITDRADTLVNDTVIVTRSGEPIRLVSVNVGRREVIARAEGYSTELRLPLHAPIARYSAGK